MPDIQEPDLELRVVDMHVTDGHGVVVFTRSGARDSVVVDASVLAQLSVGDVLSDYEGAIER